MVYVETDFLLALAKESDWLKERAESERREREVSTSILAYAEFLLLADKYDIDRVRAVSNLLDLVPVLPEEHTQAILKGVTHQDDHEMTTFNALHAGIIDTQDVPVLGSEQDYDDLDLDRIPLEPDRDE